MSIIKESGIACYELIGSKQDLDEIEPLLAAQSKNERRLFAFPKLLAHYQTGRDAASMLIDYWATNDTVYSIKACAGKRCIGFITVQTKPDYYNGREVIVGEIVAIYVRETYREKGVARELMVMAEALLAEKGVHAISTSWLIGNDASQNFYVKNGYTPITVQARKLFAHS